MESSAIGRKNAQQGIYSDCHVMVGRERAIIFEGSVGDDGSPDVSTCMSSRCWDSGVAWVVLMGGHARGGQGRGNPL